MRLLLLLVACSTPESEPSLHLGSRGLTGYHVLAGGSGAVPQGELGFFIAADGQGGFVIEWTGSDASFAGSATTDVAFDANRTLAVTASEDVSFSAANHIDFSGAPGAMLQGLQLATTSEPIYLDLTVGGSRQGFGIFFTGARTRLLQQSAFDPVALTSP